MSFKILFRIPFLLSLLFLGVSVSGQTAGDSRLFDCGDQVLRMIAMSTLQLLVLLMMLLLLLLMLMMLLLLMLLMITITGSAKVNSFLNMAIEECTGNENCNKGFCFSKWTQIHTCEDRGRRIATKVLTFQNKFSLNHQNINVTKQNQLSLCDMIETVWSSFTSNVSHCYTTLQIQRQTQSCKIKVDNKLVIINGFCANVARSRFRNHTILHHEQRGNRNEIWET